MKSYQVFISHAAEDKKFAEPIRQQLEAHGVRVFDPQVHLVPGMVFQSAIERALDEASVLLVIFSPNTELSHWSEYEYRVFQEKMFSEEGRHQNVLIPIIAGDGSPTSLPRALRRFKSIRADATEEIVEATLRHLADGSEMDPNDMIIKLNKITAELDMRAREVVIGELSKGSKLNKITALKRAALLDYLQNPLWSQKEWLWRFFFLLIGILVGFFILGR
jgi:hypothetical protein